MKCPFCGCLNDRVLQSRSVKDGEVMRRRRECADCGKRFTTFEQVRVMVTKRDGRNEPFDRGKVLKGIRVACQKRPVTTEALEEIVDRIERAIIDTGAMEVESVQIGEMVMDELRKVDQVAYIRFASVYRQFEDIGQFREIVDGLGKRKRSSKVRELKG
jgi:transcriptional repressor NrdR